MSRNQNRGGHRSPSVSEDSSGQSSEVQKPSDLFDSREHGSASSTKPQNDEVETNEAVETRTYHVVMAIMRTVISTKIAADGKEMTMRNTDLLRPGTVLELTDEEAREYGERVKLGLGKQVLPPDHYQKRRAGKYRVVGPGAVIIDRRVRRPGSVITLTENDARRLAALVEELE
jgi:hypothetical protein